VLLRSQLSQIGLVLEEPEVLMEEEKEKECEICLVSDTLTQDTKMSEPPSYEDDFFV